MKNKITLPKKPAVEGIYSVALTKKAMEYLKSIASESSLPLRSIASDIITQAVEKDLIEFATEEE